MASIVDSYSETNANGGRPLDSADYTAYGQSFTGNGQYLGSCKFYLSKTGSPTGNAVAKLYEHSGTFGTNSVPTGSALATSSTVDVSTISGAYALITFTFDGTYSLVNGTKYVIVLEYTGGNASNKINVGTDTTSPTHGGNFSQYNGSWGTLAYDLSFYVYDTSSYLARMALLGVG